MSRTARLPLIAEGFAAITAFLTAEQRLGHIACTADLPTPQTR
jgi:hypothetical protein